MGHTDLFLRKLSASDIEAIKSIARIKKYAAGERVFSEGDDADSFYVIDHGKAVVFYDHNGADKELCTLGDNDYFGEMAIYNQDKRCASVEILEQSLLLKVKQKEFAEFTKTHPDLSDLLQNNLQYRNEELHLREDLIDLTGVDGKRLHVSIKGDPSMRESAFVRERYESVVDKVIDKLEPVLEALLLKRCVYNLFINFNSGEIRTSSIFNPFVEELHTPDKLINAAYVNRHFPEISFSEKGEIIKSMYQFISDNKYFANLPEHNKNIFSKSYRYWQPVSETEISRVIRQLRKLRSIENFYLRNLSISMILDVIRMQFNCDGTHIVSAVDYQQFLEDNLEQA